MFPFLPVRFMHAGMIPLWMVRGDIASPDDSRFIDDITDGSLLVRHPDYSLAGLSIMWMLARYCTGEDDVGFAHPDSLA